MHKPTVSRSTALIVVLGLFLSGCGVLGDDAEAGGRSSGAGAGKAPGVTEDSIKIGVTYVDLESIQDIVDLDYGDYEATYQALFDDLNDQGGINGRRLTGVRAGRAGRHRVGRRACLQLTEEDEVFVTVGHFLNDTVLGHVEEHDWPSSAAP